MVLTKFQPFRGMSAAFRGRFLSNAGGFDKIPAVSGLSAAFREHFLSNAGGFDKIPAISGLARGLLRAFFCQTGVVLTKSRPFRGMSAGFSGAFLSNAST